MKKIKRKCYTCGKMATGSYTYSIVPTHDVYRTIPPYSKGAEKIKRSELKGVITYNYCNVECYEKGSQN